MTSPSVREVFAGMREVSLNLAKHFAVIDPERSLSYRHEVEAIDATVALIDAVEAFDIPHDAMTPRLRQLRSALSGVQGSKA